jgi:uncharacterized SAM-binding protein YcdF (DUF218 family)
VFAGIIKGMTHGRHTMGRVVGRYLGGSLLVAVLVVLGTGLRVAVTAGLDHRASADAIVVLGAAQYDGDPSVIFAARLDHAVELYQSGGAPHILTVGGSQQGDAFTEAESGRNYLVAQGVPADAIDAVGEGNDTLVSLRAGATELLSHGWSSVVLVTDPWHAFRSSAMARDLGLSVQVSSVASGPAAGTGVAPRYLFRETLGTLYYRFIGGSSGLGFWVI